MPICYKYTNLINIEKNNKNDKYIIFSSKFQMNLTKKQVKYLLMGHSFKRSLKGYYQTINICAFISDINNIVPIVLFQQQAKMNIYTKIFLEILKIF